MTTVLHHFMRALGHLPISGKERIIWRLRKSLPRLSDGTFDVDFDGLRYAGSFGDLIDCEIFYFGRYAPAELDFLDIAARVVRLAGKPPSYFDIGANVGQHALFMSRRADQVIAFEPSPSARKRFGANVAINRLANIRILPVALGESDGAGWLGSGLPGNSGSRSLTWTLDEAKSERVAIRNGDDLLRVEQLPSMDILKLDVEGYERRVLSGLRQTLMRDRPIILMELIGGDTRGGFGRPDELHDALYSDHVLFTLSGRRKAHLAPFDWNGEAVVCLPVERVESFATIIAR